METLKHIVVVDDNPVNLELAESALRGQYKLTRLISGIQLLKFLGRITPDMILLDIEMPQMDGYETIRRIKENPDTREIPLIFLTGRRDIDSEREGFRLGALDFITKPFDKEVMLSRIRTQLELQQYRSDLEQVVAAKTSRIEELQNIITVSCAEMIESRDGTTGSHVRNTADYFEALLQMLLVNDMYGDLFRESEITDLLRASAMHDIGKIGISDQVLKKPGALSPEEFNHMKTHSRIGADMIQKIINRAHADDVCFLRDAREMALYHHEKWDGSGYPCGLCGEEIPVHVRALSIVDVYDALTSVRPYKRAFTHEEALKMMIADRGSFFCPNMFDIFLDGSKAMLEIMEHKKL